MVDPALAIATPLIAGFEGFRADPYPDTGGVWTQGYGCTFHPGGRPVVQSDPPITEPEGMAWMQALLVPTMTRVRALVRVPISDNAAASLCSFAYNTGTGALANSTLLRLLNERDTAGAAQQFGAWIHDARGNVEPGLVRRRDVEMALFLKADGAPNMPENITRNITAHPPSAIGIPITKQHQQVTTADLNAESLAGTLNPTPEQPT